MICLTYQMRNETPHVNNSSIGWGSRIHQLHLCRGVSACNKCPGYDSKQSHCEAPVLELWGMWSISSVDFLGNFSWRMPIFFKSIDHSFLVICKRIATSHDLFLIFIANFYVKINLNIKICELICFI